MVGILRKTSPENEETQGSGTLGPIKVRRRYRKDLCVIDGTVPGQVRLSVTVKDLPESQETRQSLQRHVCLSPFPRPNPPSG